MSAKRATLVELAVALDHFENETLRDWREAFVAKALNAKFALMLPEENEHLAQFTYVGRGEQQNEHRFRHVIDHDIVSLIRRSTPIPGNPTSGWHLAHDGIASSESIRALLARLDWLPDT